MVDKNFQKRIIIRSEHTMSRYMMSLQRHKFLLEKSHNILFSLCRSICMRFLPPSFAQILKFRYSSAHSIVIDVQRFLWSQLQMRRIVSIQSHFYAREYFHLAGNEQGLSDLTQRLNHPSTKFGKGINDLVAVNSLEKDGLRQGF